VACDTLELTKEVDDQESPGKEIWRGKCTRFSWRKMKTATQRRAGGDEWSVVYDSLEVAEAGVK